MDFLKSKVAVANIGGAMEADTISKNGRSSKSLMSRINNFCLSKTVIMTFICIITFQTSVFSNELYIFVTKSGDILNYKAKISLDGKNLVEIGEGKYWSGNIGNKDSYELKTQRSLAITSSSFF